MTNSGHLAWLPERLDWAESLVRAKCSEPSEAFPLFKELAQSRMDFVRAGNLDKAIERYRSEHASPASLPVLRLAVLGSSTLGHLLPGIRLGALRRGLLLETFIGEYGIYRQELALETSALYEFKPDVVLLCLHADHVAGAETQTEEAAFENMRQCWQDAKHKLGCIVIQQTVLPVIPYLIGNQEYRFPESPANLIEKLNTRLRATAEQEGIYLLTVDRWAAVDGLSEWFNAPLWFRSKQEIHPKAALTFGDQVGRLLGALQGRSAKCLVLDLDNTLWGGVIGDDGLAGIVLGQGSTVGEAHLALQRYALRLSRRGIILAVCSKNDLANALSPFDQHHEMILRREHIACFIANWDNKADNLRHIADTLRIGLDSLVFVDDNPAERALIRRELPMVAVPELAEDPAGYVATLEAAGYFEAVQITQDDQSRSRQYQQNAEREQMRHSATDMESYLDALQMILTWSPFDQTGLKRIVQLANKTNQFNLTTRRYTESEIADRMNDSRTLALQFRLADTYGDNGIIGLLIGTKNEEGVLAIETWLMSCRVLGRKVEEATLDILVEEARALGCTTLLGAYHPSEKNAMVAQHYRKLGFLLVEEDTAGNSYWSLALQNYVKPAIAMQLKEGGTWKTPTSTLSLPASSERSSTTTASY